MSRALATGEFCAFVVLPGDGYSVPATKQRTSTTR
jgi:hypothetical protein